MGQNPATSEHTVAELRRHKAAIQSLPVAARANADENCSLVVCCCQHVLRDIAFLGTDLF
jgi:hypothetical protein